MFRSYGCVIYEIYTFGEKPYKQIKDAHKVRAGIRNGTLRLSPPEGTPPHIAELMISCFAEKDVRPTFRMIKESLFHTKENQSFMDRILSYIFFWQRRDDDIQPSLACTIPDTAHTSEELHTATGSNNNDEIAEIISK